MYHETSFEAVHSIREEDPDIVQVSPSDTLACVSIASNNVLLQSHYTQYSRITFVLLPKVIKSSPFPTSVSNFFRSAYRSLTSLPDP